MNSQSFITRLYRLKLKREPRGQSQENQILCIRYTKGGIQTSSGVHCKWSGNDVAYLAAFEGSLWDASASAYILDDSQVADFAADMLCSIANAKPLSGLTQNATRANIRKLAENVVLVGNRVLFRRHPLHRCLC